MATAIVQARQFEEKVGRLKAESLAIVVKDAETCLLAKRQQSEIRRELKLIHAVLDPFVINAKAAYDDAKTERSKYVDPLEALDSDLAQKVKDYERLERERTQREQDEFNRLKREREARAADERRREAEKQAEIERKAREKEIAEARKAGDIKAAEARKLQKLAEEEAEFKRLQAKANAEADKASFQEVTVKPNIPTVSGVPSRTNWRYRVVNLNLVPDEYWMLNEQKIGADVRRDKDKTKIPGIEPYPD